MHLYINLACLFVCLYPINVKTVERVRILYGTSRDPREGLKNFKKCVFKSFLFL